MKINLFYCRLSLNATSLFADNDFSSLISRNPEDSLDSFRTEDEESSDDNEGHEMCRDQLKCLTCRRVFKNETSFAKHKSYYRQNFRYLQNLQQNAQNWIVNETLCYHKNLKLIRHNGKQLNNEKPLENHRLEEELLYKCGYCNELFDEYERYKAHSREQHSDSSNCYICHVCGKRLSGRHRYVFHMNKSNSKMLQCDLCGGMYRDLANHKRRVHRSIKYFCKTCDKEFSNPFALKAHERIHAVEKPFRCRTCATIRHLMVHEANHLESDRSKTAKKVSAKGGR